MSLLGSVLGFVGLAPLGPILDKVRPNPYAPRLPDQVDLSTWQAGGRLRGGLSGRTGSEADWADDQEAPGPANQADWGGTLGPSWFSANDPPRYYTGPVRLLREPWGGDQRARAPLVRASTLGPPTAKTPLPRDVQSAYEEANAARTGPTDIFEEE
jgi:hypothetical protein